MLKKLCEKSMLSVLKASIVFNREGLGNLKLGNILEPSRTDIQIKYKEPTYPIFTNGHTFHACFKTLSIF